MGAGQATDVMETRKIHMKHAQACISCDIDWLYKDPCRADSSTQAPKATIWEKPFFEVEQKKMRSAMTCKTPRLSSRDLSPETHLCKNSSEHYSKNRGSEAFMAGGPTDLPSTESAAQRGPSVAVYRACRQNQAPCSKTHAF